MTEIPPTPSTRLINARRIAVKNGIRYAFTGNIRDPAVQATYCSNCHVLLIGRGGYEITAWHLTADGKCARCGTPCAGIFAISPGTWAHGASVAMSTGRLTGA